MFANTTVCVFGAQHNDSLPAPEARDFSSDEAKLAFIRQELKKRSVLVYCDDKYIAWLQERDVTCCQVKEGLVDHQRLCRGLDTPSADGNFTLICASTPDPAMRGTNYRAP